MKRVSEEEFYRFIKEYPKPLERHVTTICEPFLISYNDFSDGRKFPETSIVAKTWFYSDCPGDYFYTPKDEQKYYIEDEVRE